ncbi:nucleolar protein dao-5-like isoform X2 [Cydia splendana]|uniref:nucleolar protein dao-5-like isoform X2 n=1 Tax=Cydia splendana TaxID=1100963 RepID=UPI00300D00D6
MSDMEEPPMKVLKMDVAPSSLDSTMEGQEEGQEEWLSEGVLTDDDYMAANPSQEPDAKEPESQEPHEELETAMQQDIEDTLNNFERVATSKDEFNDLLKKDPKESEPSHSEHSDDGHNTDELLRMLGEDDGKKKKVLTTIREKNARRAARSSEDDYFLEGAKVTKLKVAKNAIIRTQPMKAEPEDFSDRDSDMSDDEESTVKRMFTSKPRPIAGRALKSSSFTRVKTEKPKPTPVKQYTNTSKNKSLLKPKAEHPEIINEEEFLEDDDFDLDEDVGEEWRHDDEDVTATKSQPIRRPERMDEEIPSDDDSHSEDDSLYDVMPSSDSEDMDDWFSLDIRAERAGDYLPWLGDKAHKLLTEEKHRVSSRLAALRQSVTALQSSGRVQTDQIKVATEALHELDAMLAAS